MELQSNVQKNAVGVSSRRIGFVTAGYALHRIRIANVYKTFWYEEATEFVDAILARGNFASMVNAGGQFFVKELVLA